MERRRGGGESLDGCGDGRDNGVRMRAQLNTIIVTEVTLIVGGVERQVSVSLILTLSNHVVVGCENQLYGLHYQRLQRNKAFINPCQFCFIPFVISARITKNCLRLHHDRYTVGLHINSLHSKSRHMRCDSIFCLYCIWLCNPGVTIITL